MIIIRLKGGLGNQFFQYAAGRALAQRRQTELVMDTSWFGNLPNGNTYRKFELDKFFIEARLATFEESSNFRFYHGRIMRRLPFLPRKWHHGLEEKFEFDSKILMLPDNTYLDGYWQSHLYFDEISGLIRRELQPDLPPGDRNQDLINKMVEFNSVAIHIRRGDYITNASALKTHGVCELDYYSRAIKIIIERVPNPYFYIFSDDINWSRDNLNVPGPVEYIGHNKNEEAFQDLRLIASCRHQIIANSSFSWWGAWLNPSAQKIVVAPRKWFLVDKNISTLLPKDWILV